jgi:lysozyme family protein
LQRRLTQTPYKIDKRALGVASSYSDKFLRAIAFILPHEEEFARGHWGDENHVVAENVSGDSGGVTKYGIDASSHPGVDIANLSRDDAVAIYWTEWEKYNIDALPEKIAIAQFDVRVNGGYAVKWLQRALNEVGAGSPSSRLSVDGAMGPATIAAANACDETAVVRYFIKERDARFESIATGRRAKFLNGWERRDRDLEKFLGIL